MSERARIFARFAKLYQRLWRWLHTLPPEKRIAIEFRWRVWRERQRDE